ncbi:hypothetical protein BH18THE2_BH18THE2_31200 [soil metagenome]
MSAACSPKNFSLQASRVFLLPLAIENMTRKSNVGRKNRRDDNYGRAEAFAVLLLATDCPSCPTLFPAVGISINGVTP